MNERESRLGASLNMAPADDPWRSLVRSAPDFMLIIDSQGTIQYINRVLPPMRLEDVIGTSVFSHAPTEYHETMRRCIAEVARTGRAGGYEAAGPGPEATMAWYRVRVSSIVHDGAAVGLALVATDITDRRNAESALRDSEERYRSLFDHVPVGLYRSTPDGRILSANRALVEMLGYPDADSLLAVNARAMYADAGDRQRLLGEIDRHGLAAGLEFRLRRRDGTELLVEEDVRAVRDADGVVRVYEGCLKDVTERKHAERALLETKQRLDHLLRLSPAVLYACGPEPHYATTFISENVFALLGLRPQQFCNDAYFWQRRIHPEDVDRVLRTLSTIKPGRLCSYEYRFRRGDGQYVWLHDQFVPAPDDAGKVIGLVGSWFDVTSRKQAEETLRKYEHIVSTTTDLMSFVDADYVYRAVNDAYLAAFQRSKERIIGQPVADVVGRTPFERIIKPRLDRCLQGESVSYQEWFDFPGRGRAYMDVVYTPFREPDGTISGVTVSIRDITERKRAEEDRERLAAQLRLSQRLQAVGQLAAGVAHDFNSVLTVLLNNIELMKVRRKRHGRDDAAETEAIAQMTDAVERGRSLVQKLLAFGRTRKVKPQNLDLNRTIADLRRMMDGLLDATITLEIVSDPALKIIRADASQIEQAIINLLINARDAMPGGGTLEVKTANVVLDEAYVARHPEAQPGPQVMLAVRDTGQGMSADVLEHLFEPFFTTKPTGKGTGLGLSIVHGVVQQAGGHIDVESEPGKGSQFKLYFPAVE